MPFTHWTDTEGLQFFCRHLVALCVTYRSKNSDNTKFSAYSGTLITIEGVVFLLTAGHILRNLEKARESDEVKITSAALADTFGLSRISDIPIPFDLKNAKLLYIDIDEEGLDFGVIPLSNYYVNLLAKNGVIALAEENWIHQAKLKFDGYAMLGLPDEYSSAGLNESGAGRVAPTMFRVHRLDPPPSDTRPTVHPRFVGRLDDENPIKSVVGMSGGPVFGFVIDDEKEKKVRYWVVALQSSWNPKTRTVYACQLPILASLMTRFARGEMTDSEA